ncbi:hypothetical protein SUGI_0207810 [Cryptomeria japonica]|uniref:kinesin-like protein KIN-14R n=1 Tax=Cryptomeria japonica TaxID=3369 RepID=UPI002408C55E|nr:kinesin-like protein KIN-14R [Cryptomeria japonica]GLJ13213.1 hypothetical protein SUGI_0207810 [Cryptomeria japonica]
MEYTLNNSSTGFQELSVRAPVAASSDHDNLQFSLNYSPRDLGDMSTTFSQAENEDIQNGIEHPNDISEEIYTYCSDEGSDSDLDDPVLCRTGLRLFTYNGKMELNRGDVVLSINAGGQAVQDALLGLELKNDVFFTGGDVLRTEENIAEDGSCVYQSARYGDFCYIIKDLPAGDYFVDLHFAEIVFTNGPPGMRVFDVFIQDHKILSELDIYARVGSNTPLVLMDAKAMIAKDNTLTIRFQSVIGSPIVCGICIRKVPLLSGSEPEPSIVGCHENLKRSIDAANGNAIQEAVNNQLHGTRSGKNMEHRVRRKTAKYIEEYEKKIDELTREYELKKNECHEAWMSLNDSNHQLEMLRIELDSKSFLVQSLEQAIEGPSSQLRELQENYKREKKFMASSVSDLRAQIQLLKKDYIILSEEAHNCATAIPNLSGMTSAVQALVLQCEDLKVKYTNENAERKKLYNKVLELKGNIRVFCRCRPLSSGETLAGASSVVEFDAAKENELSIRVNGTSKKAFKFDRVFTPQDDQVAIFADTAPVAVSVLDGYNVCIFAYGQTGTGKTFTMEGTEENRGVNYRTLEELFRVATERNGLFKYDISVSVLEVYNEQIRDLLASPPHHGQIVKKLEIKQVAEGVHHVPGLVEAQVHIMSEVWEVLQTGSSARAVGSTNANEHSSRSHCILCVMVKGESLVTGECTRSKLWLVDLAGSERIAKTDVQGERLKEAQSINKSLSALGDVISALATKSSHIPYRNSKLTHLLQDSLGGDSKTLMFVQISPNESDSGETLSSLNFATRVRGIELGPPKKQLDSSELLKYKQMFEKAKQEVRMKDDMIKMMEENTQNMEANLKGREQLCRTLHDTVKELEEQLETMHKEHQEQLDKENMQYLEKLNEREQICINLEEKVKQLQGLLDSKIKEQQLLSQKLSEKPPIVLQSGELRSIPENAPFRMDENNMNDPLTENKLGPYVKDNVIAGTELIDKQLKELEEQPESKLKDQQLEKSMIVHQLEDWGKMNECTPFRTDPTLVNPLTESKSRVASKGNAIAGKKITQERESLTKINATDFSGFCPERGIIVQKENNGKLDDLPSKTLPKGIGRASCPMVQRATASSAMRRVTVLPLPVRKNQMSELPFLDKNGGMGNNGDHQIQQCDINSRGLHTANRVRNGIQGKVQFRGPNVVEDRKKRKQITTSNEEEIAINASATLMSGEQNLHSVDNGRLKPLSSARTIGKGTIGPQKILRGKEKPIRGWSR